MNQEEIDKLKQAGEIAKKAKVYAKENIKQGMPLKEIADKIEDKIIQLNGKPAFPVNLGINEMAAHSTPSFNDEQKAQGLLKVDLGVHIDGYIADTAFTIDLENNEENQKLIQAVELAREKAIEATKINTPLSEIGKATEQSIKASGFQPVQNLSGHKIDQYSLHAGLTIPNFNNSKPTPISEGVYAIEPFATTGLGSVRDGGPSGIYRLENPGNVRDSQAREILKYIQEKYNTLPFCSRWLQNKFGSRTQLALKRLEDAGILKHYNQLIEKGKGKVAQAEHTIIITEKEKIITT